jgi:hypothetical protein
LYCACVFDPLRRAPEILLAMRVVGLHHACVFHPDIVLIFRRVASTPSIVSENSVTPSNVSENLVTYSNVSENLVTPSNVSENLVTHSSVSENLVISTGAAQPRSGETPVFSQPRQHLSECTALEGKSR